MIKLIITGFAGKMGQALYNAALEKKGEFEVVAGVDIKESAKYPIPVYANIDDVKETADGVIDFSRPQAIEKVLPYCCKHNMFAVICTTGFTPEQRGFMDSYATRVPIFTSGNMSLGVNLQMQLVKQTASTLGLAYEPEIVEKHHHLKVDAPSGTALMLADAISGQYPEDIKYSYGRYTRTERRKPTELGIHSVRGGTIVGEHECYFIGTDEVVEINHRAYSKRIFAEGALRAAAFMQDKQAGLYSMQDIVLENDVLSNLYAVDNQAVIMVKGLGKYSIADIFKTVSEAGIFVDMISVAAFGEVSFTVNAAKLYDAVVRLEQLAENMPGMNVYDMDNITKITVEGMGMEFSHGVAAQIFEILENAGVKPILVTTSETKVAVAIENSYAQSALSALSYHLDL